MKTFDEYGSAERNEAGPDRNLILFFGAGISLPAGMPSTEDITRLVLNGEGIVRHTNDTYDRGDPTMIQFPFKDAYVWRVLECLKYLKTLADKYYRGWSDRATNYEDLFYMAIQIYDGIMYEYDNPLLIPALNNAREVLSHLLHQQQDELKEEWDLKELFEETTKYITDMLRVLLGKTPQHTSHLQLIKQVYEDKGVTQVDIFTLNHDRVLEEYCYANSIRLNDGFVPLDKEFRVWDSDEMFIRDHRLRLFKLHGSINWYRFRREIKGQTQWVTGKVLARSQFERTRIPGLDPSPFPNHPLILVGTYNKVLEYQRDLFFDLQMHFYLNLRNCNRVFVSGYSFNDRAINTRLINWMNAKEDHCIVIAHRNPEDLIKHAGPEIRRGLSDWKKAGRLTVIPKWIEYVNWDEVEHCFEQMRKK